MEQHTHTSRSRQLKRVAFWGGVMVSAKVFLSILYQYRWYFPPDFDASPFLSGRRFTFTGLYRSAFYLHLVAGPLALIFGTFLMTTGGRAGWSRLHRMVGKTQLFVVLGTVVPSGLIMSMQAYGGTVSQSGFVVQSVLTGITILLAAVLASSEAASSEAAGSEAAGSEAAGSEAAGSGNLASHRRWATRCYILLWSPLLLRVVAGLLIVSNLESEWTYRLNAWLSWLLPLAVYEGSLRRTARRNARRNGAREGSTATIGVPR